MKFNIRNLRKNIQDEKVLYLICSNLSQIYKDGLRINDALMLIKDAVYNNEYKKSLECILMSIESGKTLSESFSEFNKLYPKLMIFMIRMGEESGELYFILSSLEFYYSKICYIKKYLKKSLIYPGILLFLFMLMCIYLFKFIVPDILNIYDDMGMKCTSNIKLVKNICIMINEDIILFLICFVIYIVIVPWMIIKLIMSKIKLKLIMKISILKKYYEYKMLLIFYVLFTSKINLSKGLSICAESVDDSILCHGLKIINEDINKGYSLSESLLKMKFLSSYSLGIVKIHEESGSLEKAFLDLCNQTSDDIVEKIKMYLSAIQPVLIISIALIMSLFIFGIIMPILEGVNNIVI